MPPFALRLILTTAGVLLALFATEQLRGATGIPSFMLLLPVVILATAAWGAVNGVWATVLTTVGMALGIVSVANPVERALLTAYVGVSAVSVWVANRYFGLRRALTESEAEFRAFFELAAVASAKVEPHTGRILQANQNFSALTGYDREELLSKTIAEVTHPDDRQHDQEMYTELRAGRQTTWSTEKRYVRKDGRIVWVLVNGTLVRHENGQPSHFIAHAVDISARRRAEEEANQANRIKDEFLATLSHELRTPLNVVSGWIHLLHTADERRRPDLGRVLPVIQRNVDALRRLTDDLLGMSDVLSGRVVLQRKPVKLAAMLAEMVESVSLVAHTKHVQVNRDFAADLVVEGDEHRLRQVFWNLLSNALKFTPDGGTVTVRLYPEANHAVVEVADTGIGIAPSFLPHVFDKFRQEDSKHTREYSGLGLGLAVARQFTELHGGTITAQSAGRGHGSVFKVTLPRSSTTH